MIQHISIKETYIRISTLFLLFDMKIATFIIKQFAILKEIFKLLMFVIRSKMQQLF